MARPLRIELVRRLWGQVFHLLTRVVPGQMRGDSGVRSFICSRAVRGCVRGVPEEARTVRVERSDDEFRSLGRNTPCASFAEALEQRGFARLPSLREAPASGRAFICSSGADRGGFGVRSFICSSRVVLFCLSVEMRPRSADACGVFLKRREELWGQVFHLLIPCQEGRGWFADWKWQMHTWRSSSMGGHHGAAVANRACRGCVSRDVAR